MIVRLEVLVTMSEDDYSQDTSYETSEEAGLDPFEEEAKKKKRRKILIIVFAILLPVVLLIVGVVLIILAFTNACESCAISCCGQCSDNCSQSCSDSCSDSCSTSSCSCNSSTITFAENLKAQLDIIKWAFLYLFQI